MVYVVDNQGEIATAYATFGPDIFYAMGSKRIPAGSVSLNPHGLMVWNKSSKQPVYVLADGMQSVMRDARLNAFTQYYEREQLVWLAVTEGSLLSQDDQSAYYEYKIPFRAWKGRLPGDVFIARVDKKTQSFMGMADASPGKKKVSRNKDGGETGSESVRVLEEANRDSVGKAGGIDFCGLPIVAAPTVPAAGFSGVIDFDTSWQKIVTQFSGANALPDSSIRDYYLACCQRQDMSVRREYIENFVADILRKEEDAGIASPAWVKDLLAVM
jgi:hypothetical protein